MKVLYSGTFSLFTKTDSNFVDRCLRLFGEVVIAVSDLETCIPSGGDVNYKVEYLKKLYDCEPSVEVVSLETLTADDVKEMGIDCAISDVLPHADFNKENQLNEIYPKLFGLETIYMCADPGEMKNISEDIREEIDKYFKWN